MSYFLSFVSFFFLPFFFPGPFPPPVPPTCPPSLFSHSLPQHSPVPQPTDIVWSSPEGVTTRMTQNNAILTVRNVATSDAGTYSCAVSGLTGQNTFSASLTVLGEFTVLLVACFMCWYCMPSPPLCVCCNIHVHVHVDIGTPYTSIVHCTL